MAIPYHDSSIVLFGDVPDLPVGFVLQLSMIQSDTSSQSEVHVALLPEFAALLAEFDHLLQPPSGLPPQRSCDQSIPLVPGSQPVFIRP
jgi:hypothetical protein